jgi:HSP20 family molecular chaperone IbpA
LNHILPAVNYDYAKRGYLLPHGCKDLIDAIGKESEDLFVMRVRLPDVVAATLMITVEGRSIRISGRQTGSQDSFESVFEVPVGYDITHARASFFDHELRIVVPKAP